jgi:hypothetical protein
LLKTLRNKHDELHDIPRMLLREKENVIIGLGHIGGALKAFELRHSSQSREAIEFHFSSMNKSIYQHSNLNCNG